MRERYSVVNTFSRVTDIADFAITSGVPSAYARGMDGTPLGRRIIAAVVPRYFENIHQLAGKLGVAYSTVHAWQREENPTTPRLDQVEAIGRLVGVDWISLLSGGAAPKADRLEDLPGWKAAVAEARARWPTRATTAGYTAAGRLGVERLSAPLDAFAAAGLAEVAERYFRPAEVAA